MKIKTNKKIKTINPHQVSDQNIKPVYNIKTREKYKSNTMSLGFTFHKIQCLRESPVQILWDNSVSIIFYHQMTCDYHVRKISRNVRAHVFGSCLQTMLAKHNISSEITWSLVWLDFYNLIHTIKYIFAQLNDTLGNLQTWNTCSS